MPEIGVSVERKADAPQPFVINIRESNANVVVRLSRYDMDNFIALCRDAIDFLDHKDRPIEIGSIRGG